MYNVRAELILRKFNKTGKIDLASVKHTMRAPIRELSGELLYYGLPSISCQGKGFKEALLKEQEHLQGVVDLFESCDFDKDMFVYDLMEGLYFNERLFDYCRYQYRTTKCSIKVIKHIFILKCKKVIDEIDRILYDKSLWYCVNDFEFEPLHEYTKLINTRLNISEGIKFILYMLEYEGKRSYIHWLYQLCVYYRLDEAEKDGFKYVGYFNSGLIKSINRDINKESLGALHT